MLDEPLSPLEARILGCLLEKQQATPEYYPLTLNALTAACNQTTNREPVMALEEAEVAMGLESLRQKGLVWVVSAAGSRATKYEQKLGEGLNLALQEVAALTVLLLRGPQTPGEIRSRSGRLYAFADLAEAEAALDSLAAAEPPLVARLPRQPGTKESRYAHLLGGPVDTEAPVPPAAVPGQGRVERLEAEVADLREGLASLREAFEAFRAQFG